MSIAAAYIRVSTDDQLEYSPLAQRKAILTYAESKNITLPPDFIFTDEGISGKKAEKRPAFMKMIALAKQKPKPFDIVLVHRFDRFARNREDSIVYKSLLRKECGIKVISITEQIEDDKFSIILESMLDAMAEYYSLNLADEVKKGMTERALQGKVQTVAPFGYSTDKTNKTIVINPEEAFFIQYIFTEFLNGTPLLSITKHLNNLSIKTHRGNPFEVRTIKYILTNPIYKGYTHWTPNNSPPILVKGAHQPIIPENIFDSACSKLYSQKKHSRPQTEYKHYLSGILKCSNCGSSLILSNSSSFQCCSYAKGKCSISHSLSIKKAEKTVLYHLKSISTLNSVEYFKKISDENNTPLTLSALNKELSSLEKKFARAKEAYLSSIDSLADYKKNYEYYTKEISALKQKIHLLTSSCEEKCCFSSLCTLLSSNLPVSQKNTALRKIITKIVFDREQELLTFYFR